jgi:hypothetical protein
MALIFELLIEGQDAEAIDRLKAHFHNLQHTLLRQKRVTWEACALTVTQAYVLTAPEAQLLTKITALSVKCSELNRYGIASREDALEQCDCELLLVHHLLTAPNFLYAHMGRDAYYKPLSELADYVETEPNGEKTLEIGSVIADEVWKAIDQPSNCKPFLPGYW